MIHHVVNIKQENRNIIMTTCRRPTSVRVSESTVTSDRINESEASIAEAIAIVVSTMTHNTTVIIFFWFFGD